MKLPWLAGHALYLGFCLSLLSGCRDVERLPEGRTDRETPRYSQLITRIEKGKYTTYVSPRFYTDHVLRVREIAELAKHREACPWLLSAMSHRDGNISATVDELFLASGTPGSLGPQALDEWYAAPSEDLIWNGYLWEPRFAYVPEDTEAGQHEIAPRCRSLMAKIERGEYTTFRPEPGGNPDFRIIREMQEVFRWKKAYPWLIEAIDSPNNEISDTVLYYLRRTNVPGEPTIESLNNWYRVPENQLVRAGLVYVPRPKRIAELEADGRDIMHAKDRSPENGDAIWWLDAPTGENVRLAKASHYVKTRGTDVIYYVYLDLESDGYPARALECTGDGTVKRYQTYSRRTWQYANALMEMTWLSDSRIFVDTHVNPSLGIGLEVDLDTETLTPYYGTDFTWDRDRERVAHLLPPPHFGTPPDIPSKLMVGHEVICEVPRRLRTKLRWHPTEDKLLVLCPPADAKPGQLVVVAFSQDGGPVVKRWNVNPEDL